MTITVSLWLIFSGAMAGLAAVMAARGRNRLVKAAVIGAAVVLIFDLARGLL